MGRYTQAKRRGGGVEGVNPDPPPPLAIDSVTQTGGGVVANFNGNITVNANPDDGSFTVATANVTAIAQVGPANVLYSLDGPVSSGDAWALAFAPAYIDDSRAFPERGRFALQS